MSRKRQRSARRRRGAVRFVTWFRHHITGRIIRAKDYGLKAFPIRSG